MIAAILYFKIGFIYSLVIFCLAELTQGLFTEQMELNSLFEIITDVRVILAFTIVMFFWPIAFILFLYNNFFKGI